MSTREVGLGGLLRRGWLLAAIALLALGAVACSGDDDDDDDSGDEATATATAEDSDDGDDAAETMEITVRFEDNFFDPDTITIPAGTTVTFKYENVGAAVHNMIVQAKDIEGEDFSSESLVNPGDSGEFTGTFTTVGEIQFICAFHLPDMVGTITVE